METFIYRTKSIGSGKKIKGEMQADSELSVRKILIQKKLEPIDIRKKTILNSELSDLEILQPRIKLTDINFFCKQFAAMIQAGISIGEGIRICADQCPNKSLKKHLEHIHQEVSKGKTLSEAIRKEKIFPDLLVNMIECGEASGNLDQVLKKTVNHFDHQLGIDGKVKKALAYPLMVLMIVVAVVALLMVKVIPNFMDLLTETGADMPLPTKVVIGVSNFCVAHWLSLLAVFIVSIGCGINLKRIPICRRVIDEWRLKVPVFGNINKRSISAAFSSTMSMLVQSGIPMLQAMEITRKIIGNSVADEELQIAIEGLKEGQSLYAALSGSIIYPPIMYSMISIGEETGTLDEMLNKISIYFNEEVSETVDHMTLLIEPILTIVMAVIVGGIMLAVILPTFSAASAVM